jgi:hypothetical protein
VSERNSEASTFSFGTTQTMGRQRFTSVEESTDSEPPDSQMCAQDADEPRLSIRENLLFTLPCTALRLSSFLFFSNGRSTMWDLAQAPSTPADTYLPIRRTLQNTCGGTNNCNVYSPITEEVSIRVHTPKGCPSLTPDEHTYSR